MKIYIWFYHLTEKTVEKLELFITHSSFFIKLIANRTKLKNNNHASLVKELSVGVTHTHLDISIFYFFSLNNEITGQY